MYKQISAAILMQSIRKKISNLSTNVVMRSCMHSLQMLIKIRMIAKRLQEKKIE